ncbi:12849_t:CDS:2 [Funneliformis mosseae]|uniref:12849_t:CDS:1 n=1 Tax=Funneliformis mosseae TaxID=27381 RepID=A0A9N8WFG6_FUNMO|nr:12849_t:CDS:2 [Funneliformis mosseae]
METQTPCLVVPRETSNVPINSASRPRHQRRKSKEVCWFVGFDGCTSTIPTRFHGTTQPSIEPVSGHNRCTLLKLI